MTSETTEAKQTADLSTGGKLWNSFKTEAPFFLMVLGAVFTFRLFFFGMNYIPSESMQPALEVGDRIVVNKLIYGYSRHSFPFSFAPEFPGENGRLFGRTPKRGEVITFKNPLQNNTVFIKRVIGIPGDRVQYRGGRLLLNGKPAGREKTNNYTYRAHKGYVTQVTVYTEMLNDEASFPIYEVSNNERLDTTEEFLVPDGHLFVMGDNRDNSTDSRAMKTGVGFLPIENVLGRADRVLFSTYRCKKTTGLHCAKRKFFGAIK